MIKKEAKEIFEGEVREVLPNLLFRLELDDGREVLATLKGKMKLYRIKKTLAQDRAGNSKDDKQSNLFSRHKDLIPPAPDRRG